MDYLAVQGHWVPGYGVSALHLLFSESILIEDSILSRYAGPESAYIKHFREFLLKKKRLAADEWGADPSTVADIFVPLEQWLLKEVRSCNQRCFLHNLTSVMSVAALRSAIP